MLLPMDRISSCVTSNSSETRISLSVPSRVANLSTMGFLVFGAGKERARSRSGEGGNFHYFYNKITTLPHGHSRLQFVPLRLTNREGPVLAPPSLFYLGSMSCG